MPLAYFAGCAVTALATGALLVAERRDSSALRWATKPLAAAGFVGAAWALEPMRSPYGVAILVGLTFSAFGDVLLIPKGKRWFMAGLAAFLCGHCAFAAAFAVAGTDWGPTVGAAAVTGAVSGLILRWLWPHLPRASRAPVVAYVAVLTGAVALSVGTSARFGTPMPAVGALAFYLSDLSVARDRFVARAFVNRAWGLPLYFGSQLALAWTIRDVG
jgi:uncharacterized membrane protein YhhN